MIDLLPQSRIGKLRTAEIEIGSTLDIGAHRKIKAIRAELIDDAHYIRARQHSRQIGYFFSCGKFRLLSEVDQIEIQKENIRVIRLAGDFAPILFLPSEE